MPSINKVAVVTGGGSGIGKATALWMGKAGFNVAVADIDGDAAQKVAADIQAGGTKALALAIDVSDSDQVASMIEQTVDSFGGIRSLVNNAADIALNRYDRNILDTDFEVFDRAYSANLRSVFAACKFALPHMLEQGGGTIVNVSSIQSLLGDMERIAYSASKAGINSLTRSIATAYGKQGIRCNTVCPGPVMNRDPGKEWPEPMRKAYSDQLLTTDVGSPEQLAELIGFLASDQCSFVNGETIAADGGFTNHMHLHMKLAEQA